MTGIPKEEERVHEEDKRNQANKRSNRKEAKQHGKHTSLNMAYDAQTRMMHVRFKYAWHGKVHKQILQVKWRSICNELHIDETPHYNYLVDSRLLTRQD